MDLESIAENYVVGNWLGTAEVRVAPVLAKGRSESTHAGSAEHIWQYKNRGNGKSGDRSSCDSSLYRRSCLLL